MGDEREAERISHILDFGIKCGIAVEKKGHKEIEAALARELASRGKPYLWVVDELIRKI